ncbi:hypothetical protein [Crenobacter caeni]|uniref:DUF1097 domain-containing protein n=1 Tax=Crenobacter caeni TaxID=2705474 RepID=A0A6B2KR76_9NEIS|nr:hypothetical protein [Crenobacter caeni]NDV12745.1 hypothetical protein [Crenobacter caeni]
MQAPPPTLGRALLINCGIVLVVGAYLGFLYLVGVKDSWITFFFLWYFASIRGAEPDAWLPAVLGALAGYAFSSLLLVLPAAFGAAAGLGAFIALVFVVVLMQVMGRLALLINPATFLFMMLGTIPMVLGKNDFAAQFSALAVGIAFWSALIFGARSLFARNAARAGA